MEIQTANLRLEHPYYLLSVGTFKELLDGLGEGSHGQYKIYSEAQALDIMHQLFPDEDGFALDETYTRSYVDEEGAECEFSVTVTLVTTEQILVDIQPPVDYSEEIGWCGPGCVCFPEPEISQDDEPELSNDEAKEFEDVIDAFSAIFGKAIAEAETHPEGILGAIGNINESDLSSLQDRVDSLLKKYQE